MMLFVYIFVIITISYVISIGYVIIGWLTFSKNEELSTFSTKKISVVIAFRNEQENIINCLKSFEKQCVDKTEFELILVNDHSEDNSKNLIQEYAKTSQLTIFSYDLEEKTSKKEALAFGIEKSSNPIIASTDADCIVPENWIKNIANSFKEEEVSMLLGPVAFNSGNSLVGIFQNLDMLAIQGITFGMMQHKQPILNNGANIAFKKKDFIALKGYDKHKTPSGDDVFLLEKFSASALTIKGLFAKNHIVTTQLQTTWKLFFQQRLRWASKSKYYTNKTLIYFSSIIYITNLMQVFIYLGIPLVENFSKIAIILLISKWQIDFILLYLAAKFFNKKNILIYVVLMQLFYPIYIVVIGLLSMLVSFNWKGRLYK